MPKKAILFTTIIILVVALIALLWPGAFNLVKQKINPKKEPILILDLKSNQMDSLNLPKLTDENCSVSSMSGNEKSRNETINLDVNSREIKINFGICAEPDSSMESTESATVFEGKSYLVSKVSCPNTDSYITCYKFMKAKFQDETPRFFILKGEDNRPIYLFKEEVDTKIRYFTNSVMTDIKNERISSIKLNGYTDIGIAYGGIAYLSELKYNEKVLPVGWVLNDPKYLKELYVFK